MIRYHHFPKPHRNNESGHYAAMAGSITKQETTAHYEFSDKRIQCNTTQQHNLVLPRLYSQLPICRKNRRQRNMLNCTLNMQSAKSILKAHRLKDPSFSTCKLYGKEKDRKEKDAD